MFEYSLVDFFETADTDRDGVIDYEDFYNVRIYKPVNNGHIGHCLSL